MNHVKGWAAVAAVLSVAVLGGCATQHHDHARHMSEMLYQRPLVTVKGDIISVSPEPLVMFKSDPKAEVVWTLPSGYSFARRGITIEGLLLGRTDEPLTPRQDAQLSEGAKPDPGTRNHFVCEPRGAQQYACKADPKLVRNGIYKYSVRVLKDGKELPVADPNIFHLD
jgi:hypothetical protein